MRAASGDPVTIPDRAMLQATDLHGAPTTTLDDDSWARLRPPQPCAEYGYPSAALPRSSRSVSALVGVAGTGNVTAEYVGLYWPNGARRYVQDLHRALEGCRGIDAQDRWKIVDAGLAGRHSLLLRLRQQDEPAGRTVTRTTFIAIARVGRLLLVVADIGGEAGEGRRELVAELIGPAFRRAGFLL